MQASEDAGNKWVYVKVKRKKSTFFLHIDLTETILEVKAKLQDLIQKDPKEMKLFREGAELQDSLTLADSKVENGDTLALTFALLDEPNSFEEIDITPHDGVGEE
ncbi:hypothetical protein COCSUDRAFT_55858 [Coccomyxa subellipsoidea C-169]|uniref:Ubiquitin-like domain-containing protein n=1 Tax=Coccomyxa subellipsoidea (strain C-169) TaxID=574566 RepID=I0YUU0_COCSC|nr:hypothetical protein COCSUDRAFT_55858 [Coccomyxa subellipsoidea C-169]EIE22159.1 hypothetical protein COCSUDRAFT_55858 [Coccomyxa subellipsoidea C-169]|eukprot:XP_005646703.1 hypothetical protein COCSUDRAFT_55858 [Coccomyxa subellipsoidea C-169]